MDQDANAASLDVFRPNKPLCKNDRNSYLQKIVLTRMSSFNLVPKILNEDTADDGFFVPRGLSIAEFLKHYKEKREPTSTLLKRQFFHAVNPTVTDLQDLEIEDSSEASTVRLTKPNQIRLLQWNMLAQALGQYNDNFIRCPDKAINWEHRKFLIIEEILRYEPDIICLQEVDHFQFLQKVLFGVYYSGIFVCKPDSPCLYIENNNGPDGCAIFYRRDKLELLNFESRVLEVWRVPSNQVVIASTFRVKTLEREICVFTTHLKARSGTVLEQLRNEQGRDILEYIQKFAKPEHAVILCGDFNAQPNELVYGTILRNDVKLFGSAYADFRLENMLKTKQKQEHEAVDEKENVVEDRIELSKSHEPPYTTWKIRGTGEECHTIDYVFYDKEQLNVLNCLEFPTGSEIGETRTPCFKYPSDHFSLVCDFEILDQKTE